MQTWWLCIKSEQVKEIIQFKGKAKTFKKIEIRKKNVEVKLHTHFACGT